MSTGSRWTCPGFETVEHPGARVLARPEAEFWVRSVLEGGQGLHAASARERDAVRLEGRNPLFVIPAQGGGISPHDRWAVRHYVRGGRLVPALMGDRYLRSGRIRPYHETEASEAARARGIPTPRVVAAALYPQGVFYRADLVTDFIPDTIDLVEALFDTSRKGAGGAMERMDALQAAGRLVQSMARVGIRHRDLHAGNVLLQWRGMAPTAYLVDLDRCEVGRQGQSVAATRMFQRLRRSLLKWEHRTRTRISEREWSILETAATEQRPP